MARCDDDQKPGKACADFGPHMLLIRGADMQIIGKLLASLIACLALSRLKVAMILKSVTVWAGILAAHVVQNNAIRETAV